MGALGDNNGIGATWVFANSGGVWSQQGSKLIGTGASGMSKQGKSVSLSNDGNTALIGAPTDGEDVGVSSGAAYIFTRAGSSWTQQGSKLVGSGYVGGSTQGSAVSLSGDGNTAIIGGLFDNPTGAAWIFIKSGNGTWSQQGAKLVDVNGGTAQQGLGVSLSYDGNKALVGGHNYNSGTGSAWLYTRSAGTWAQSGNKLIPADNTGAAFFGIALCLSADGNTAVIGGNGDNNYTGAIWIFSPCMGASPQATISGAASQSICSGNKLLATATDGKLVNSYSWSDGSTLNTSNPIRAAGTYTVTITNSCANTFSISQVISTINSFPAPVISGNAACSGTVTLIASDANATPGPFTYSWSNGSTAAASNPINTNGTFTVSITNGGGCMASASQVVTQAPISITSSGGTGASGICYPTLKAGFDAVNNGTHTGSIAIIVVGNSTEIASCVLNASGTGTANYTSISLQPSGGVARTISAGLDGFPLIDLNGASNILIDGLNTNGNALTFTNTSTATDALTSTVRFINDASNNKLTNCTIFGNSGAPVGTAGGGTISTAITTGNNNNTISYCNIGSSNSRVLKATRHIYIGGTPGKESTGILIDHNNIYDYSRETVTSAGVDINTGNTGVVLSNNKFYQTASIYFRAAYMFNRAISINNTSGGGYQVINNQIGFANSIATGTYTVGSGLIENGTSSPSFVPIYVNVGAAIASSIEGNIIAGISVTGFLKGVAGKAPFIGIYAAGGLVNIGDINGNTIGSMSATGSITFPSQAIGNYDIIGILVSASSNSITNNNTIGGIAIAASVMNHPKNFYRIKSVAAAGTSWTCNNNTIGGAVANSINYNGTVSIEIMNGITNTYATGSFTGNTIRNMSTAGGTNTSTNAGIIGIFLTGSGNQTLSQNTIYNLTSTATGVTEVAGITMAASGTSNLAERNFIYGLSGSGAAGSTITGMRIDKGTGTYVNNMIAVGQGISTASNIYGLYETGGLNNIYHNSVYISGAPASGDVTVSSAGFFSTLVSNARSVQNNIFFNARSNTSGATDKHYALSLAGTTGLTIDHNLYYATGTGSNLGYFNNTDIADLPGWRTATAQDAGSIYGDPVFAAPTDVVPNLHINLVAGASIVDATGTDVGILNDFDGQTGLP